MKNGLNDLSLFCKAISFLDKYVDEIELKFEDHNIIIDYMDPSRIMLAQLTLKDIVETEANCTAKFKIDLLKKILKNFKKIDFIDFTLTKEDLIFRKAPERFSLKREIDWAEFEIIPFENLRKIPFEYGFEISKSQLKHIIKRALTYSEVLKIYSDLENVGFQGVGGLGEYVYEETEITNQKVAGNYSNLFLRHLNSQIFDGKEQFKLSLKTDHPIQILYDSNTIKFEMYLAPRVEEADFDDDEEDDW